MTGGLTIPTGPIPGDNLCFSIKEFGEAMGAAQGAVIHSTVEAMVIATVAGIIIGVCLMYLWMKGKEKIDEYQVVDH